MSENPSFESYLFLSPKKFIILINEEVNKLEGGAAKVLDTSTVGASVAEDTVRNAITAVIVAVIFVMLCVHVHHEPLM